MAVPDRMRQASGWQVLAAAGLRTGVYRPTSAMYTARTRRSGIVLRVECGEDVLLLRQTGLFRSVLQDANAIGALPHAIPSLGMFRDAIVHSSVPERTAD
jgi:hypothetical protein